MSKVPVGHRFGAGLPTVALLFLLSGAAGLVYEVVWTRLLVHVFGATVLAVSTVLAAFMAGLALGSYLFGRIADRASRPLALFAALQIGIGVVSLAVPLLVRFAESAYPGLPGIFRDNFWLLSLARFAWCGLIILAPTTLMGGTLPVLSKWVTDRGHGVGSGIGSLYSVNTFGAVVGTLGAGFFMIPSFGLSKSMLIAASASVIVGLIALAMGRTPSPAGSPSERVARPGDRTAAARDRTPPSTHSGFAAPELPVRLILTLFALVGFCSLAYEVLWMRVLIVFVPSTTFAFTTMLSTFLVGIAVGSSVLSRFVDRLRSPALALGIIEGGVAVTALASLISFPHLSSLAAGFTGIGASWERTLAIQFLLPVFIMIVPALLMGAAFPVVARIRIVNRDSAGRGVGSIYAANTVGAILGSFASGFVLIPAIGIQASIILVACGNLVVAVVALARSNSGGRSRLGVGVAAVAASVLLVILAPLGLPVAVSPGAEGYLGETQEVVFYDEGITASVTITESPGQDVTGFFIDRWLVVGTSYDARKTVKLLGHLPIAAVDSARDVMIVGYGMGMTTHTLSLHNEVESIEVVELSEGVVEASYYFSEENHDVLEDPRVSLHVDDGRNHLLMSNKLYDVISCDPIHPAGGSGALYTSDFFRLARSKLKPGGAFVQYLPFHKMSLFDLKVLVRTFQSVFPDATIWDGAGHGVMLGTVGPTSFDIERLERMVESDPELHDELALWGLADPAELLSCLMLDAEAAATLAGEGPINSDDHPILEFTEPRSQGRDTRPENLLAVTRYESSAAPLIQATEETRAALLPRLERSATVRRTLARAMLEVSRGDIAAGSELIEDAWVLAPDDPDVRSLAGRIAIGFWLDRVAELLPARRFDEALTLCRRALTIEPENYRALMGCATIHASQEQWDEAIAFFERMVASDSSDATAVSGLAQVYEDAGRIEDAARAYARLGEMEGVNPTDVQRGLSFLINNERYAQATGLAEIYSSEHPEDVNALGVLGQCYAASGRIGEAIMTWEKALELRPGNRQLRQALSDAYRASGSSDLGQTQ